MRNLLLITIIVFMTVLDSAFAENKDIPKSVRENNSDTDNRASQKQTKSFGIAAQGSQWLFLSGGAGISVYSILNPSLTVGFEFYSLKADDYGLTPISYGYGYRRDVNGLLSSIFSHYFVGNTFAINTGLIYAKYKEFGYLMSHKNTDYYNLDASIISLKAGLGNYWKWNFGLTFGFEWVGFVLPAIQKTNTVTWSSDGAEYEGKKSVDKLSQTNIQFLTLSLGYEF